MGSTIKCPTHRETKIETLVEKGYKQYYISRYCFSCWLEQEYKKEIEKYEEKLKEYKSKWLNIFEFPPERPNSYEFKKRYRGYANHGKSNVNAFKEELRQEYYRRNTPADFNVVLRLNGVEFENNIEALFQKQGFSVTKTPATGDGGVDLVIAKKSSQSSFRIEKLIKKHALEKI